MSTPSLPGARAATWWSAHWPATLGFVVWGLALVGLARTGGSLNDPDVWWHVRTGRHILDTRSLPDSDPWSFTAPDDSWVPTAWLADVAFASVWHLGGYDGVRLLRVALALAVAGAVLVVARKTVGPTASALLAAGLVVLVVRPFLQERPAVVSLVLTAALAWQAQQVLASRAPHVALWVGVTWLWANLHGLWVLAPMFFAILAVLVWLADRSLVQLAARCALTAILATVAAALTPVGPRLAVWPLVVRRVVAPINEWQAPALLDDAALPFTTALLVVVISWWAGSRVSVAHVGYVVAVAGLGYSAVRLLAPAAVLLLPELARATSFLLGRRDTELPRFGRWVGAILSVGAALAVLTFSARPTYGSQLPFRIAAELAQRPAPVRVLNHYDVGGLLTGLAAPPVQVAIDGRTDIWSGQYVRDYVRATTGADDWRPLVDQLNPQVAVLPENSELARGLVLERGWRTTLTDGRWVLLEPG